MVSALATWPSLVKRAQFNRAAVLTVHLLRSAPSRSAVEEASKALTEVGGCRAYWFQGLLAHTVDDEGTRNGAWVEAMRCSSYYVSTVFVILPNYRPLAEQAVHIQPESADAWFWLARIFRQGEPQTAIEFYRRGLALRPTDGLRWRELGDLLAVSDPQAAIEAYLQSCYNGDPGSNGCVHAGLTAERLGDIENAIRYYRLSGWSGSWEKAARLEQQMQQTR